MKTHEAVLTFVYMTERRQGVLLHVNLIASHNGEPSNNYARALHIANLR